MNKEKKKPDQGLKTLLAGPTYILWFPLDFDPKPHLWGGSHVIKIFDGSGLIVTAP